LQAPSCSQGLLIRGTDLQLISRHCLNLHKQYRHAVARTGFETEAIARSCKEIRDRYEDGQYYLNTASGIIYQTFSDMTTTGSWTLVGRMHENNNYGKCEVGNRWSSQQGNGEGNWATFGTPEGASDMSVKQVPNNSYGTLEPGLHPALPHRDTSSPFKRETNSSSFKPGVITFRAINNERAAMAICSGIKPTGCNSEHYSIGGGGHFPGAAPILGCPLTGMSMDTAQAGVHLRRSLKLPCLFHH
uniref:Fibrinogen C-terminal domain-containing protein n=1 Tax=Oncorhynchus kisutch TaxID=8019 RepID=A0A8C7K338_ONCKI